MFTTTLYPMNFDKKNNLTQSIGCFFDDAELTIIAGTAQGICKAKEQPEDLPLVFPSPILPSICRHSVTVDRAAHDWIALLFAGIPRVSLHGVDDAILAFLYNAYMVD